MDSIVLNSIEKDGNKLTYHFTAPDNLKKFFRGVTDTLFTLEYTENIESVPDGVLAVPFAGAMLPISWLTNCELVMAELDQDFYNSIPEFKKGFIGMYPDAEFRGYLSVKEIKECRPQEAGRAATFFSGGLDATTTLLRHIQEKPDLFILWGSDIDFNNAEGWNVVWKDIVCKANQYQLNCAYVRTSFRIFDDEMALSHEFEPVLHYRWWYAIKYGIGLITHAAPYAWLHGISDWYIASSKCIEDGNTVGASYPTIDNYIVTIQNPCFCEKQRI